jgi:hypothetical protein
VKTIHNRNGGWEFYKSSSNPDIGPSSSATMEFGYAPDGSGDVVATLKEEHGTQSPEMMRTERMRTYLTDAVTNLEDVREVKYVFFHLLYYYFV